MTARSSFWCLLAALLLFPPNAFADQMPRRLSAQTIERIMASPEKISFSKLPETECVTEHNIKRCIGIYIAEVRKFSPSPTNWFTSTYISYILRDLRLWVSDADDFVFVIMETSGDIGYVSTDQAELHGAFFKRALPKDQLARLGQENWTGEDFFANVELKTNVPTSDLALLERLSEVTGADFEAGIGNDSILVFRYPTLEDTISKTEHLLFDNEV